MNELNNKEQSWTFVIVILILFCPVGFYLLWNKLRKNKKSLLNSGKAMLITGLILISLGVIAIIGAATGNVSNDTGTPITAKEQVYDILMYFIIFICSGGAFLIAGYISRKQAKSYKKYIDIINRYITSIETISATAGVPYETAKNDLQKMIEKGYFEGAYINDADREIVIRNQMYDNQNTNNANQYTTVTCKGCGATNKVAVNMVTECEYCGYQLSAK